LTHVVDHDPELAQHVAVLESLQTVVTALGMAVSHPLLSLPPMVQGECAQV
jgi:hypothetical protein